MELTHLPHCPYPSPERNWPNLKLEWFTEDSVMFLGRRRHLTIKGFCLGSHRGFKSESDMGRSHPAAEFMGLGIKGESGAVSSHCYN